MSHLKLENFPGGPVAVAFSSNVRGVGLFPGQRLGVPHALWPKNWNMRQKQHCNRFTKTLEMAPIKNLKSMNKFEVGYLNLKLNEEARDKDSNLGGMAE